MACIYAFIRIDARMARRPYGSAAVRAEVGAAVNAEVGRANRPGRPRKLTSAARFGSPRGAAVPAMVPRVPLRSWLRYAAPALAIALLDAWLRGERVAAWPAATTARYVAALALGGVTWGALVAAAERRRAWGARLALVLGAMLAVGAQVYFFARYHAYMNPRAVLVGTSMLPSVGQQLWSDRASFLRALVPPVAAAVCLPWAVRR